LSALLIYFHKILYFHLFQILQITILAIAFSAATSYSPVRAALAARTIAIIRSVNEAKEDGSFNYKYK